MSKDTNSGKMKVAVFHPYNLTGGWGCVGGYKQTLERMGHHVIECAFPGNQPLQHHVDRLRKQAPTLEQLNSCDVILSLHHEYNDPWLSNVYDYEKVWEKIKTPVVGRLDESVDRYDLALARRYQDESLTRHVDVLAVPAAQDAKALNLPWVPHAIDPYKFTPLDKPVAKRYDLAFIGTMYGTRPTYARYLQESLMQLGPDCPTMLSGSVVAQDLSGVRGEISIDMLVDNYRQIKVFFCLPTASRLITLKVLEAMACGTFVMCPRFPGDFQLNCDMFEDGKHLVYYDIGQFIDNARQITTWLYDDKAREKIAAEGCKYVREKYTLEAMFQKLFALADDVRAGRTTAKVATT